MRIKRVKIKNFRTLYDVTIDFHNITTFIGPNGSGKSTVLYALDWFFNGSKDGELTEEDATYNHADEPIECRSHSISLQTLINERSESILHKAQMNLLLGKLTTKAKRSCPQTQKVTLFLTTLRD